jgi:adenine-specific DNA-methyltransferase
MGCEKESTYVEMTRQRLLSYFNGTLRYRPIGTPVYQPTGQDKVSRIPDEWKEKTSQARLLERREKYK